jgi:hypothetical protein
LQWLQDPSEINGDILNNVKHEASRQFWNKKKAYLKARIIDLATSSKNKNMRDMYRGINEFKRFYQPRNNLVKDRSGDLLRVSDKILSRRKSYLSHSLKVQNITDTREIEIHTE